MCAFSLVRSQDEPSNIMPCNNAPLPLLNFYRLSAGFSAAIGYACRVLKEENLVQTTDHFVAETSFYVRYAETDAMGIVHHASYIVYFEEGRSNYARQRGNDYASFERNGYFLTIVEISARYVKPVRYGQRLTVRCWITELKSRTVSFEYEIIDAETREVSVTGFSKHICITHDGRVSTLPPEWRQWANAL
jgi:acyl-CoA thioester hydrolase